MKKIQIHTGKVETTGILVFGEDKFLINRAQIRNHLKKIWQKIFRICGIS